MKPRAIVVGIDGSEAARRAVRWATRETSRRRARLLIVHAVDITLLRHRPGSDAWIEGVEAKLATESKSLFAQATADAAAIADDVEVETRWDGDDPAVALQALSRDALMIVLGQADQGALTMALGSLILAVSSHAECPVVVARGEAGQEDRTLPVLVGVDGGPLSDVALAHAFDAASYRGARLRAVLLWSDADIRRAHLGLFVDPRRTLREAEELTLAERLAGWRERYPDVEVESVVEYAKPAPGLVQQSRRARLVVIATRGRGGFAGLLLGSVGLTLVRHSPSPVMLVGPNATRAHR